MNDAVRYDRNDDGIVTLTLDQPGSAVNLLNADFAITMQAAVDRLEAERDEVTGVLVRSAKKTFFAGADLSLLHGVTVDSLEEFAPFFNGIKQSLRRLEQCGRPVAAVVNGAALGGGLEVALAAHRRFGVDHPGVRIGFPEVTLGLLPGAGGVTRTVRLLGVQRALPLLLQGTRLRASEALAAGLLDDLAPSVDEAVDRALAWLRSPDAEPTQPWDRRGFTVPDLRPLDPTTYPMLAAAPAMLHALTRGAAPAPEKILAAAVEGAYVDIDTALDIESRYFFELLTGPVAKNMIGTFWFGLNEANNGAARPDGFDRTVPARVGVIGAGTMGAGIAYVSAYVGIDVVLKDISADAARAGRDRIAALLDGRVADGKLADQRRTEILTRIVPTATDDDLAGCDLVIEAVFEDRALKESVLPAVEAAAGADAIIASNTSTLPITGLATSVRRPEAFVGLHFFSPVHKMPLVEIIRGERTEDATLAKAFDYVRAIGKTPIVVNDSRGFFTSRVFGTYVYEGIAMLVEGVPPALVENVAAKAGMPVGPLAVADEVSLALLRQIRRQELADAEVAGTTVTELPADVVLRTMVEELGRTGRSGGAGFYDYPNGSGGTKRLWPELGSRFAGGRTSEPAVLSEDDVRDRLLFAQALETQRCLAERVVESERDADLGSILGIGFPAWTGGAASFVRAYGRGAGRGAFAARAHELAGRYGERFTPVGSD